MRELCSSKESSIQRKLLAPLMKEAHNTCVLYLQSEICSNREKSVSFDIATETKMGSGQLKGFRPLHWQGEFHNAYI